MGQPFLPVFKKLLWNGRDDSQLPGDHQSCLVGHMESLALSHTLHLSRFYSGQVNDSVRFRPPSTLIQRFFHPWHIETRSCNTRAQLILFFSILGPMPTLLWGSEKRGTWRWSINYRYIGHFLQWSHSCGYQTLVTKTVTQGGYWEC